jgi:hypothetical protein
MMITLLPLPALNAVLVDTFPRAVRETATIKSMFAEQDMWMMIPMPTHTVSPVSLSQGCTFLQVAVGHAKTSNVRPEQRILMVSQAHNVWHATEKPNIKIRKDNALVKMFRCVKLDNKKLVHQALLQIANVKVVYKELHTTRQKDLALV